MYVRSYANVLKCKARLKIKLNAYPLLLTVFLSDESLLRLLYDNGIRLIKVSTEFLFS